MSVGFKLLCAALGAEILGIDLAQPLAPEEIAFVRRVFRDHKVIVVRGQNINGQEQRRFAEYFGSIQGVRTAYNTPGVKQDYMYVGNVTVEGMKGVLSDGEMQFHYDQCYYEVPSRASMLYAMEIPSRGGNTCFANAVAAYERLPAEIKRRIDGLSALHVYDYAANPTARAREVSPDAPRFVHPVVIRHPETGHPVLFVNRLMTDHIVGIDRAESDRLMDVLFAAVEAPEIVYEHVWRVGDLLMWDNFATLHARTDFDPAEKRVLRRYGIQGSRPLAWSPAHQAEAARS